MRKLRTQCVVENNILFNDTTLYMNTKIKILIKMFHT